MTETLIHGFWIAVGITLGLVQINIAKASGDI